MAKLRIMSNNLWWCDNNVDPWKEIGADCSVAARAPGFARLYNEVKPDIIGLQECSARMTHELMSQIVQNGLPYALLWGRDTPIAYRIDLFELVESQVRIYPEEIPGLEGSFNNLRTKSYCIAVLRHKESGKLLIFATTHLWYKSGDPKSPSYCPGSEEARAWQMGILIDKLGEFQDRYDAPAVIVGDFNTWPAGAAVRTGLERGFVHAHDVATDHADNTTGMHRCDQSGYTAQLREGDFDHSIDHILVRGFTEGAVRRYDRICPDWYFPLSDHSPVWMDIEL